MPHLEVSDLRKFYGDVRAVDGVSFSVEKGTCFGLLGPNGAGKTTAISAIVGVARADSGSVRLDGRAMTPDDALLKSRIGYVPQELALYEELSAHENLRVFGLLYGMSAGQLRDGIDFALKAVNLSDRSTERVHKYSGGMKRRLNIAMALLHGPELIVLDEPTVGVDPQSRNSIFESLKKLQAEGRTLIYTTHYMEEVEKLCDSIAVMDHGKIIACGSLGDLKRRGVSTNLFSFEVSGDAERCVAEIDVLPSVVSVHREGSVITVGVEDFTQGLHDVMGLVGRLGLKAENFSAHKATLESLFLDLTGRSLRD